MGLRERRTGTYIIEPKQIRRQAFGKVLLDAGLLPSEEMRHFGDYRLGVSM